jgi:hypothetical protein
MIAHKLTDRIVLEHTPQLDHPVAVIDMLAAPVVIRDSYLLEFHILT